MGGPCPFDCLCTWNEWRACSTSCGDGEKTRECIVTVEARHGGKQCLKTTDSKTCSNSPSPGCCKWDEWGDWSPCSRSCEKGTKSRSRKAIKDCTEKEDAED